MTDPDPASADVDRDARPWIRRSAPTALGLVLLAAGSVAFVRGLIIAGTLMPRVQTSPTDAVVMTVLGGAALVVGTALLVPSLLLGAAAVAPRRPLVIRRPFVEAARHPAHAAPVVIVVMTGAMVLDAVDIASLQSPQADTGGRRPVAPPGMAHVPVRPAPLETRRTQIDTAVPGAVQRLVATVSTTWDPAAPQDPTFWTIPPPGCTATERSRRAGPPMKDCLDAAPTIVVVDATDARVLFELTDHQHDVLAHGGALVAKQGLARDGHVTLHDGRWRGRGLIPAPQPREPVTVPATSWTPPAFDVPHGLSNAMPKALIGADTARRLGMGTSVDALFVNASSGPLSDEQGLALMAITPCLSDAPAGGTPEDAITVERRPAVPLALPDPRAVMLVVGPAHRRRGDGDGESSAGIAPRPSSVRRHRDGPGHPRRSGCARGVPRSVRLGPGSRPRLACGDGGLLGDLRGVPHL